MGRQPKVLRFRVFIVYDSQGNARSHPPPAKGDGCEERACVTQNRPTPDPPNSYAGTPSGISLGPRARWGVLGRPGASWGLLGRASGASWETREIYVFCHNWCPKFCVSRRGKNCSLGAPWSPPSPKTCKNHRFTTFSANSPPGALKP